DPPEGAAHAVGLRRPEIRARYPRGFPDRPEQAQPVRRVEGCGRYLRAGIRPLLRDENVLPARWLPDGAEPQRRGAARLPILSIKCNLEGRLYKVYGYKGKQVRDNIHSLDVARFMHAFWENPRTGAVYNLGGGRANSCSILEAFDK